VSELRSIIDQLRAETLTELPDAYRRGLRGAASRARAARDRASAAARGDLPSSPLRTRRLSVGSVVAREHVQGVVGSGASAGPDGACIGSGAAYQPCSRRRRAITVVRAGAGERPRDRSGGVSRRRGRPGRGARIHSRSDLQRIAMHWRHAVEREHAADPEERIRERRRLSRVRVVPRDGSARRRSRPRVRRDAVDRARGARRRVALHNRSRSMRTRSRSEVRRVARPSSTASVQHGRRRRAAWRVTRP
jgi:hypothetical protein